MQMKLSVKNRIFLLYITLIFFAVGVVGWYGYSSAKNAYIENIYDDNKAQLEIVANRMQGVLQTIPSDVFYNANFFALQRFLIWEGLQDQRLASRWRDAYIDNLRNFLKNKKYFYQIRLLDPNGKEKIVLKYNTERNLAQRFQTGRFAFQDGTTFKYPIQR